MAVFFDDTAQFEQGNWFIAQAVVAFLVPLDKQSLAILFLLYAQRGKEADPVVGYVFAFVKKVPITVFTTPHADFRAHWCLRHVLSFPSGFGHLGCAFSDAFLVFLVSGADLSVERMIGKDVDCV